MTDYQARRLGERSMKHIGFTGTRHGMTTAQRQAVADLLSRLLGNIPAEVHHGDCVGADAQFHAIARHMGGIEIVAHPPNENFLRAFCEGAVRRNPKTYLARNRDIVAETAILIAAPHEATERLHSGTWATVRQARKLRRPVYLVLPDGAVITEEDTV